MVGWINEYAPVWGAISAQFSNQCVEGIITFAFSARAFFLSVTAISVETLARAFSKSAPLAWE